MTPGETVAAAFGFVACLPFIVALNWAGSRLKRGRTRLPWPRPEGKHRANPIRHQKARTSLADRVDLSRVPDPRPAVGRVTQSVVARLPRQLRREEATR